MIYIMKHSPAMFQLCIGRSGVTKGLAVKLVKAVETNYLAKIPTGKRCARALHKNLRIWTQ